MPRFFVAVIACLAMLVSACGSKNASKIGSEAGAEKKAAAGRMIVLGFDGVDPRWLERWANEGKLPNLKKLMDANGGRGYRHLGSTNPPQSPVAWATFSTGTLPGDHGIYDFIFRKLVRAPQGPPVIPQVATTTFSVPEDGPPVAHNLRTGEPFWKTLGDDGVKVLALNVPYSFPAEPMREGRMLSGLGVPDLRETNSTFTYAGTDVDPNAAEPGGGDMIKLNPAEDGAHFELVGPSWPGHSGQHMTCPVDIHVVDQNTMRITISGQVVVATLRQFSPWVPIKFEQGKEIIHGIVKLLPLETTPGMRLFITPISFDPRAPYAPISYPNAFAQKIAEDIGGLYKTVGWDHDTSALNAEVVDEGIFLRDMGDVETQRQAMLRQEMKKDDWQLLVWVSTATDRVAHMFYRLMDKDHPRYDAALAANFGDAIEKEYRRMDSTVGEVVSQMKPNDTLMILSDHGFHNYRRGLHVNQWLLQHGYLKLKHEQTSSNREFLSDVDWSETRAYALGTGQIYINVRGRERDGIVNQSDALPLARKIREELKAVRDTEKGDAEVVHEVYVGADVYHGRREADAPDLQIAFAENYRTSWETILGATPEGLFADNTKKWSGDHAASDVTQTPGILVSNRAIVRDEPSIVDLPATIMHFFGHALPPQYVGTPVF